MIRKTVEKIFFKTSLEFFNASFASKNKIFDLVHDSELFCSSPMGVSPLSLLFLLKKGLDFKVFFLFFFSGKRSSIGERRTEPPPSALPFPGKNREKNENKKLEREGGNPRRHRQGRRGKADGNGSKCLREKKYIAEFANGTKTSYVQALLDN